MVRQDRQHLSLSLSHSHLLEAWLAWLQVNHINQNLIKLLLIAFYLTFRSILKTIGEVRNIII